MSFARTVSYETDLAEFRVSYVGELVHTLFLERFLSHPNVDILLPDMDTTRHYASLFSLLRAKGKKVGVNDLWIAAIAKQYELPILTLDSDFSQIPEIMVLH